MPNSVSTMKGGRKMLKKEYACKVFTYPTEPDERLHIRMVRVQVVVNDINGTFHNAGVQVEDRYCPSLVEILGKFAIWNSVFTDYNYVLENRKVFPGDHDPKLYGKFISEFKHLRPAEYDWVVETLERFCETGVSESTSGGI
jgi:hypothetical protein